MTQGPFCGERSSRTEFVIHNSGTRDCLTGSRLPLSYARGPRRTPTPARSVSHGHSPGRPSKRGRGVARRGVIVLMALKGASQHGLHSLKRLHGVLKQGQSIEIHCRWARPSGVTRSFTGGKSPRGARFLIAQRSGLCAGASRTVVRASIAPLISAVPPWYLVCSCCKLG